MLQLRYTGSSKPPVWLVAPKYIIGSDAECDCVVNGDGVAAKHAELCVDEERLTISRVAEEADITLNGVALSENNVELKHGDSLTVGAVELEIFDPKLLRSEDDWLGPKKENTVEWSLLALNSALGNRRFPIEGQVLLGRSKDCDISLAVSHLSRKHARLSVSSKGLLVEDLQSSNGTFVNGKRVQQSVLKPGDELGFDTLKFRICCSEDDEEKTSVRPVLKEADIKNNVVEDEVSLEDQKRPAAVRPQVKRSVNYVSAKDANVGGTIQLLVGVILVTAAIAGLGWFLLV